MVAKAKKIAKKSKAPARKTAAVKKAAPKKTVVKKARAKKPSSKKTGGKKVAKTGGTRKKASALSRLEQALFARMVELDELAADTGLAGAVEPAAKKGRTTH